MKEKVVMLPLLPQEIIIALECSCQYNAYMAQCWHRDYLAGKTVISKHLTFNSLPI